jgi:hypothetical protein
MSDRDAKEKADLNEKQCQVIDLVNNTSMCIFVSGKAGTGKTKLIKELRKLTYKKFLVVAPTGVAAVNAGGVTVHSLFQLKVGRLYTPGSISNNDVQLSSERQKLIQGIDLLIVDEASMVRCDILDAVDQALKSVREPSKPYGGLQVLFVGDLYQLPPVYTREEWKILSKFYKSPFFIDSQSFYRSCPVTIELEQVYRQHDEHFIKLLNDLRTNSIAQEQFNALNQHVLPIRSSSTVTLTTHNHLADQINASSLAQLSGDMVELSASVDGDFDTESVIADITLRIKVGAPVMLIRNYEHNGAQYYNGKIGILEAINSDELMVRFDDQVVPIRKAMWQSFDYVFDETKQVVKGRVTGSFEQFPLRLAWAITIHKSQGLSFDAARIDVEKAFTAGQVYVALSRLRSIEGLTLSSALTRPQVKVDPRITEFFSSDPNRYEVLGEKIHDEKTKHLKTLLTSWFDLSHLGQRFSQAGSNAKTTKLVELLIGLEGHAKKFLKEVDSILALREAERFSKLRLRVSAAANYFENQLAGFSNQNRELINAYEGDILYKKVLIFLKGQRRAIEQKRNQLKLAKKVGEQINSTQDLGKVLVAESSSN